MFQAYVRRIPRVNLSGAIALGRALLAATDLLPRLSEPVLRAKRLLASRLDSLTAATRGHAPYFHDQRSPIALAGRNLDANWVALHDFLEALAALPAHCSAARSAVEALVGIFPNGFELVRPPPLLEWAESEARLGRIDLGGFEATLRAIGGGPFVEAIREAHAAYGRALGNAEGGAWSSRAIKRSLDASVLAIHAYVTCVIAELCDGDPESTAHLHALLAPLDFVQSCMDARSSFFEETLEAHPPPPPIRFDEWNDDEPLALAV
ncbi:MAG: hypothetical protein IPM54_43005 [Polyangiaceae bacterium]|nr:hypothetical protein [Polyangiaceae bacterium]